MGSDFSVFGVDFGSLMIDVVFEYSYVLSGILVFAMVGRLVVRGRIAFLYTFMVILIWLLVGRKLVIYVLIYVRWGFGSWY